LGQRGYPGDRGVGGCDVAVAVAVAVAVVVVADFAVAVAAAVDVAVFVVEDVADAFAAFVVVVGCDGAGWSRLSDLTDLPDVTDLSCGQLSSFAVYFQKVGFFYFAEVGCYY